MTISSTTARKDYVGNGVTTSFSFPYYVIESGDLKVYQKGELKTITTHYTLSGSAPYLSGTDVQFVTAPAADDDILLKRDPPITQTVDPVEGGDLPVNSELEQPLDKLTMILQSVSEIFARCIKLPLTSVQTEIDYPEGASAAARASKHVRWNAAGDGLELVTVGVDSVTGVITTKGDLIQGGTSGVPERLAVGTSDQVLGISGGKSAWRTLTTTLGDVLYGAASGVLTRLAGNTTTTRKFLAQTGDGTNSAAPSWESANETGTPSDVTSSRAVGTVYQNTSGKKLRVSAFGYVAASNNNGFFTVGSANPPTMNVHKIGTRSDAPAGSCVWTFTQEVPNLWYYKITPNAGTINIDGWTEIEE